MAQDQGSKAASMEPADENQVQTAQVNPYNSPYLSVSYQTEVRDILEGLETAEKATRNKNSKMLQFVGIGYVLYMFIPQAYENPAFVGNWIMIALCLAMIAFILFFPKYENNQYAKRREQQCPHMEVVFDSQEIIATDPDGKSRIRYDGDAVVYESKNVFCISYGKRSVLVIPKDQIGPEQADAVRSRMQAAFGDNFMKQEVRMR